MNSVQKIGVRLFLDGEFAPRAVVPAFHRWIQEQQAGELLIDVADYSHVRGGPGIALIGDAANYFLDDAGGRAGLSYQRKRDLDGDLAARLAHAVARALAAAKRLEGEPELGGRRFRGGEIVVKLHDRLRAPNTPETWAAVKPALDALAARLYAGAAATVERIGDAKELLAARITSDGAPDVATLLARLG